MSRHRRISPLNSRGRMGARRRPSLEALEGKDLMAVFTVTSIADTNTAGTLRNAINRANLTAAVDTIRFDIRNVLPVITLDTDLPEITSPILIDGLSQPKPAPNSTTYVGPGEIVQVDGNESVLRGLVLSGSSSGSEIRGVALTGFAGTALVIESTSDGNFIHKNRFGLDLGLPEPAARPNGGNNVALPLDILGRMSSNNKFGTDRQRVPSANRVANTAGANFLLPRGSQGNTIRYSPIYGSGGLGIDIVTQQSTPTPLITAAERIDVIGRPPRTAVSGEVRGVAPGDRFLIDLFVSDDPSPSGSSQGQVYVATVGVVADSAGIARFNQVIVERPDGQPILENTYISATATSQADVDDQVGVNTSEISLPQIVTLFTNRIDLAVDASAAPVAPNQQTIFTSTQVGQRFDYTVTLSNRNFSGFAANDATLSMVFPENLIIDPAQIQGLPPGSVVTFNGNQIIANVGRLNSGANVTLTFRNVVATAPGPIYAQFRTITRDIVDPNLGNDSDSVDLIASLDPSTPIIRFQSSRVGVGESDNEAIVFVELANFTNLASPVTVQYATADGSGVAGIDYQPVAGTITFNPGEFTTKRIVVPILGNSDFQPDRAFDLRLSTLPSSGAVPLTAVAVGSPRLATVTIFDDDPEPLDTQVLQFSAATFSADENQATALVRVSRTGSTAGRVSVNYATANGSAIAGQDYTAAAGTLTFDSGESFKDILVPIADNSLLDGNKTFTVSLASSVGAVIGQQGSAEVTIVDDESPPAGFFQFASASFQVSEAEGVVNITVTRQGGAGTASIAYATNLLGSAPPGDRYEPVSGVLDFGPTDVARTFSIPIKDNTVFEGSQTVGLTLTATGGAVLGNPASATLTITDDETPPPAVIGFSAASYAAAEGAGLASVTLTRTGNLVGAVSVRLATAGGTATPGADFTPIDRVVTFADGQSSLTVDIPVVNDSAIEPDETVGLVLSDPGAGVALGSQATAALTIVNDDLDLVAPVVSSLAFGSASSPASIGSLVFTFSKPIASAPALVAGNYSVLALGRDGVAGTADDRLIPVSSLALDPTSQVLTIGLAQGIPAGQFGMLAVSGVAGGLTDLSGNLLDGDADGQPGGYYFSTFGRGTSLSYRDADGDVVTLGIRNGGLLEVTRAASGEAQEVRVVNPVPFRSTIYGSVRRSSGIGRTTIQRLSGIERFGYVRSGLQTPRFFVAEVTDSAGNPTTSSPATLRVRRPFRG